MPERRMLVTSNACTSSLLKFEICNSMYYISLFKRAIVVNHSASVAIAFTQLTSISLFGFNAISGGGYRRLSLPHYLNLLGTSPEHF